MCDAAADAEVGDDVWFAGFELPAGSWEYKAALDGAWTESYGRNGGPDNIPLALTAAASVRFYYSPTTHWVADTVNEEIVTAAGSFQSELGCPGDWQPDCLRSWLQDVDGDGTHEFRTTAIPPGAHEWKVAARRGLDESYGAGGGDANIAFTVIAAGEPVTFRWDELTKVPTVQVGSGLGPGGDEDLVTTPVRTPASDEVVYFVMTDRFADGSAANDQAGRPATGPSTASTPPTRAGTTAATSPVCRDASTTCRTSASRRCGSRRRSPTDGSRTARRVPRLLADRLHADRPPPRQQRRR